MMATKIATVANRGPQPRRCCSTCVICGRSRIPGVGPHDTQSKEDAHRYRESNGVRILATLRSLALNALRLDGLWSITEGLAALPSTSRDYWHCWAGENPARH